MGVGCAVVVRAPGFERSARMGQRSKQGLIEQLVPQAADVLSARFQEEFAAAQQLENDHFVCFEQGIARRVSHRPPLIRCGNYLSGDRDVRIMKGWRRPIGGAIHTSE
jgi:hypothetical protein